LQWYHTTNASKNGIDFVKEYEIIVYGIKKGDAS